MMITDSVLKEFKARMKIFHSMEDDNLKRMLTSSHKRISADAGVIDFDNDEWGKDLVFQRARYDYNDSLEYFENNFLGEIIRYNFHRMNKEVE